MAGEEFRARQLWLPFTDAVGIVLEIMAGAKSRAWQWFKGWKPRKAKKEWPSDAKQLALDLALPRPSFGVRLATL